MRRTVCALILGLILPACEGMDGPEQDGKGGSTPSKDQLKSQDVSDAALAVELDACSEEEDEAVAANCVEDALEVFGLADSQRTGLDGGETGSGGASKKGET